MTVSELIIIRGNLGEDMLGDLGEVPRTGGILGQDHGASGYDTVEQRHRLKSWNKGKVQTPDA